MILVRPVRMQTIAAAACRWVVDREVQVVASEKPLKGAAGFLVPAFFSGDPVGFQAGRDHRLRLHRLLIEAGAFAALLIKAIGADGDKMLSFRIRSAASLASQPRDSRPTSVIAGLGMDCAAQQHGM